jgi:cellobiose-specific phosphotransferase system component IIA
MSIIQEAMAAARNDKEAIDIFENKIDLIMEYGYRTFHTNLKEAKLKVITEGGTEEDYAYMVSEAAKDYLAKLKAVISKITKAVIEFIEKCKKRIVELAMSIKTKLAVANIERARKVNQKLASIKIKIVDHPAITSAYNKAINAVSRIAAHEAASGSNIDAEKTQEELDEIVEKVEEDVKKVVNNEIEVTFDNALNLYKKYGNVKDTTIMPDSDVVDFDSTANQLFKNISDDDTVGPEAAHAIVETTQVQAKLAKEQASHTVSAHSNYLSALKAAISKFGGKKEKEEETAKESTDDVVEGLDMNSYYNEMMNEILGDSEVMTEGANIDMRKTYKETMKKVNDALKAARKAIKKDDFAEAKKQIAIAETELKNGKNAYKKVLAKYDTDGVLSVILGNTLHGLITTMKLFILFIASLPIGGAAAVVYGSYDSMKNLVETISKAVENKSISMEDLNANKNYCDSCFKAMEKSIKKIKSGVDAMEKSFKEDKEDVKSESAFYLDDDDPELDTFEETCNAFEAAVLDEYLNS